MRKCVICDSAETEIFFKEIIPCGHCGNDVIVNYNVCYSCSSMWKDVDGDIVKGSVVDSSSDKNPVSTVEVKCVGDLAKSKGSMDDVLHRCIRCNKISYELSPDHYKCSSCGFEWGVIQ